MAKKPPIPPCPKCKSKKQVTVFGVVGDMFNCGRCSLFDIEPEEGSTVFSDPSRRMELEEERKRYGSNRPRR